jgi:hypothetical protein
VVAAVAVGVLVTALVLSVAAYAIGREARRLGQERHLPTYRLPDAVEFVADRLDPGPAGRLTHDEVTTLLGWHLEELQRQADEGDVAALSGRAEVADDPGLVVVVERATEAGMDLEVEDVAAVLSLQLDYLKALGALKPLGE